MSIRMGSIVAVALGSMLSGHVHADEYSGPYVGASVGQASLSLDDTPFDESDIGFKGFAGYAFSDIVALEAAYIDAGSPTLDLAGIGSVEANLSGVNASVLLRARKGSAFAFFLKLGYAQYKVEAKGSVNGVLLVEDSETEGAVTAGVGASFLFAEKYMLRIEYEALNVKDGDFSFVSLGTGYKF